MKTVRKTILNEINPKLVMKLCSGNFCDANEKPVNMDAAIKPLNPTFKMAGFAFTVKCGQKDNLAIHRAIEAAPPKSVLIIDARGDLKAGYIGEIMITACKERKITGVIIDGACRDSLAIQNLGFPVFCRGINPGGTAKEEPGILNEVILCGGLKITPGDFIFGDADGVIVIQKKNMAAVIEKVEAILKRETQVMKELSQGKTTMEIFNFKRT